MIAPACRVLLAFVCLAAAGIAVADPLPSWNDGAAKSAIVEFVGRVTDEDSPGYVPVRERIATFDNDGTLWSEQPIYFQLYFLFHRIRAMAPDHPEWKNTEPFKSALANDAMGVMAGGELSLRQLIAASHANTTAEAFADSVRDWVATARHPTSDMAYTDLVFQPMLELLAYLRAEDFQTFIVSGGGIDFMRVFSEEVYGVPPEQVVGSQLDARFELRDGVPTIVKEGALVFFDDKAAKPVGIYRHIGRRPIFAAGNSDGDQQMLEYTTIARGPGDTTPRLGLIVHHTDAEREFAYDRETHFGKLDTALDAAPERGWVVVDMKNDWNRIYP
jgi:phosphoserine phosphatase